MTQKIPQASDDQWRALFWAFVRFIRYGGPDGRAVFQAVQRDMQERAKG